MNWPESAGRYLRELLEERFQPVCIQLDPTGVLLSVSGEHGLLNLGDLTPGETPSLLDSLFGGTLPDEEFELEFVDLGGEPFHLHVIRDGAAACLLLLPMGAQREGRRELQQIANEVRILNHRQKRLMDELVETKSELELRRYEAERANLQKSRFIASMSHEFRTPLTSVLGYSQLITEEAADEPLAAGRAGAIERAARHLLSMVDNILDEARLEDGKVNVRLAPLDLRQLADDIAAILAPLAADKAIAFGVFLDAAVPQLIESDEMRLRQILVNLLGNAVKFTDDGEVRLEIGWSAGGLQIAISDTGPGIAEADRERIFSAFERVDGAERRHGVGLGLNIVRRLVDLLGGSIRLESKLGVGSRFFVELPASACKAQPLDDSLQAELEKSAAADGGHVLIAEDNPDIIHLMQIFLTRGGYRLSLVGNGKEAVEQALSSEPDLILMDVNMPVLDGLAATRQLRSLGYTAPIVALTASLNDDDRAMAMDAGCDGYLAKPIHMPELMSAIERLLQ